MPVSASKAAACRCQLAGRAGAELRTARGLPGAAAAHAGGCSQPGAWLPASAEGDPGAELMPVEGPGEMAAKRCAAVMVSALPRGVDGAI